MRRAIIGALVMATGCGGPSVDGETGGSAGSDACGDIDGSGGDTGDVPNVLGNWTAAFATIFDSTCSIEGLNQDELKEWMDGSIVIDGRIPDHLVATMSGDDDEDYWGVENPYGGIVFTGIHEMGGHNLYTSFGGLLYEVPQVERNEIRGFATIGVDKDGEDTIIDCYMTGDWVAKKSGN